MATKEVAIKKRAQIDKATQTMLIAVGLASVVLGCAMVLSVYFIKWIIFNTKVIAEKDAIIKDFETVQKNVVTLASNVEALSENENLEVVARVRENRCMTIDGGPVDTGNNIELSRICSALRVIPDALPSVQNNEAVYASLNKLFLETKDEFGDPVEPESITPGSGSGAYGLEIPEGLGVIPVALLIENTAVTTRAVLDTIERSIRNYDVLTATIAWRSSGEGGLMTDMIELRGNAAAYYSTAVEAVLKTKTIYADDSKNTGGVR
ncbi:hypothetical protein FWF89_02415 [Candidatus Saccharibacteria bacterium]|nr:hypothetical protein [Candidatus Saccharibacteria bacterium]